MGSGDEGWPGPGEWPVRVLGSPCPAPPGQCRAAGWRAAGRGAHRATSREELSEGTECGASSNCWETPNSSISLSWQVELNRQVGSDSRQLLKAKQWSVVVGFSVEPFFQVWVRAAPTHRVSAQPLSGEFGNTPYEYFRKDLAGLPASDQV